eukprot:s126_g28.t1
MGELRENKAPASRAVSLLESIRFCHYTMRIEGALAVLESLRLKGLAAQLYATKRPWRPSDVLTLSDVEFLHQCFCDKSRSSIDRIFIGHALHLLYGRARFSDLLAITECFLDEDWAFLEVSATLHKGARSMDSKSKLLPIVAPAQGVYGSNWAKEYLELRHSSGLAEPGEKPGPMLPAPVRGGQGWSDRYVTSQEFNRFLQKLFAHGGRPIAGRKITTHSMKATGLSWCSKMGVSPENRAVLARHATSVQGATVLYSRDLISSAMRVFVEVLEAIKGQRFFPDRTRSGMITPAAMTPAGAPTTPLPPVASVVQNSMQEKNAATPIPALSNPGANVELAGSPSWHLTEAERSDGSKLIEPLQSSPDAKQHGLHAENDEYSPGTPVEQLQVKEEFEWPPVEWDGAVIDLEAQHDLLSQWHEGSEEESSGCSESDDSDSDVIDEEEVVPPSEAPPANPVRVKWYINVNTLVIHEVRNDHMFRCGRQMSATYSAVPALNGLSSFHSFGETLVQMSGIQDSEAHFAARAAEYGVPNAFIQRLRVQGVSTLGHLAFAVFRPGTEFEERAFDQWATDINNGVRLTMGAAAALRRLHFEAEVVMTSTIRASVEAPESSTPRAIPFAEKSARLDQLRIRFTGLNIHGSGEPSNALLDETCSQFEARTLKYVEPKRCTSRELEIQTGKSSKQLKLDSSTLAIKETKTVEDEAVSTTFHLAMCLKRRGLAYEFANLISFNVHELYVEKLLKHLSTDPPIGFQATTLAQVMKADREVFSFLAQEVRDIRPGADNVRPLDAALDRALRDYTVAFHLVPLPKFAMRDDGVQQSNTRKFGSEPYSTSAPSKGKGRGKGGKSKAAGSNAAPKGYQGCVGRDGKNRPICFDYNISGCNKAPPGGACAKGRHVCFRAGCFKTHSFKEAHGQDVPKGPE